jgi:hypothetical protein
MLVVPRRNFIRTHGHTTFTLDSFTILNTRAWHNDTDSVAISLDVGSKSYGTRVKHMGDVNNGKHDVDLSFDSIPINDPAAPIKFTFQIMNAGHVPQGELVNKLQDGAEVISKALVGAGLTSPVSYPPIIAGATLEALNLV